MPPRNPDDGDEADDEEESNDDEDEDVDDEEESESPKDFNKGDTSDTAMKPRVLYNNDKSTAGAT